MGKTLAHLSLCRCGARGPVHTLSRAEQRCRGPPQKKTRDAEERFEWRRSKWSMAGMGVDLATACIGRKQEAAASQTASFDILLPNQKFHAHCSEKNTRARAPETGTNNAPRPTHGLRASCLSLRLLRLSVRDTFDSIPISTEAVFLFLFYFKKNSNTAN